MSGNGFKVFITYLFLLLVWSLVYQANFSTPLEPRVLPEDYRATVNIRGEIVPASRHTLRATATHMPAVEIGDGDKTFALDSIDAGLTIELDPPPPPPPPVQVSPASTVTHAPPPKAVPASEAQEIALEQLTAKGWSEAEFDCLVSLWQRESNWNHLAENKSSGAYGIPQSLPGSKMASAGEDWKTNPATQIKWGLGYIEGRYETPCGAWNAFQNKGWY